MERIKKAVEMARQNRESLTSLVDVQSRCEIESRVDQVGMGKSNHRSKSNVDNSTTFASVPPHLSLARIEYTRTKAIDISNETLKRNRVISDDSDNAVTSAYKLLRTQVLQLLGQNSWNNLVITSPGIGNGKTLTAINMAISIAREVNHTVLLVDLDLRRPKVAGYFDLVPQFGLYDYLYKDVPLSEILIHPKMERLVMLPGRGSMKNSSEILSSPKMVRLVDELKNRYPSRIIIFDMPPLFYADDVLAFSPYFDACLLVIEEGKTRDEELVKAVDLLSGTNVIGTVLNKSSDNIDKYY